MRQRSNFFFLFLSHGKRESEWNNLIWFLTNTLGVMEMGSEWARSYPLSQL